jgi:hypothetical protein
VEIIIRLNLVTFGVEMERGGILRATLRMFDIMVFVILSVVLEDSATGRVK